MIFKFCTYNCDLLIYFAFYLFFIYHVLGQYTLTLQYNQLDSKSIQVKNYRSKVDWVFYQLKILSSKFQATLFVYLPAHLYICITVSPFVYLRVYMLSICLYVCQSVYMSVLSFLQFYLSIIPLCSVCLFVFLSVSSFLMKHFDFVWFALIKI